MSDPFWISILRDRGARVETGRGWALVLGDCLDPDTGLASLESVDHVITDPPYEKEAHTRHCRAVVSVGGVRRIEEGHRIPYEPITRGVRDGAGSEFARIVHRWVLVFCQVEAAMMWRKSCEPLRYVRFGLWHCPNRQPQYSGDRPAQGADGIYIGHADRAMRWHGGGKQGHWVAIRDSTGRRGLHEGGKPLALMQQLVADFTDPGEIICDPFAGSGTTGVACIRLARRFIGWERDPEFFETAAKRLRSTREQIQLFDASPVGKQEKMF